MSVTIFANYDGIGGNSGYFPDPEPENGILAYANDMDNYALGDDGNTWANDVSSLFTTTPLYVFDEAYFGGVAVYLPSGDHDEGDLADYGIPDNSILSFVAIADSGEYAGFA